MLTFDFCNRVAIVTGAAGGMGEAICKALAKGGCKVVGVDVKPCPKSLASLGNIDFVQGDLTEEAFVASVASRASERHGRLDYLCNVAGVLWFDKDKSIFEIEMDVWDRVFDINLRSIVMMTRACQPLMQKQGGAMVHVSTIQWMRGDTAPQDAYSASKAAVSAFSRSIAMQMAGDGIRSNVICPGATLTPMQARWDTKEKRRSVAEAVPLGRIGTPEDMANVALFLLSDAAGYITGVDVPVDGGLLLRN